jgi:hypothetical protein
MAKRYHESTKSRMSEGYYQGPEERRRQEMEDAGMIREDHSAIANMPQEWMLKEWPKGGEYLPEDLNDRISGINRQMDEDGSKLKKNMGPNHM